MNLNDSQFIQCVETLESVHFFDIFSNRWIENHKKIVSINVYLYAHKDLLESIQDNKMINLATNKFQTILSEVITTYFIRHIHFDQLFKRNSNNKETIENIKHKEESVVHLENTFRMTSYICLYHELTLLNILQMILLCDSIYENIDTYIINLIAYIYSNLVAFLQTSSEHYFSKPFSVNDIKNITEMLNEENDKSYQIEKLKIYIHIIHVLRNITDRIHLLSSSVINKIVDYDILLILIPLIDKKPWRKDNYVFENNEWVKEDEHLLTTVEKQLWLIFYSLILNKQCQEKYEMTNYRRNNILKLRKHLNTRVHEELPPTKILHKFIEHLYISKSVFPENRSSFLIIDIVPDLFEQIKEDVFANKNKIKYRVETISIKKETLASLSDVYLSIYEFDQESKQNEFVETNSSKREFLEEGEDEIYMCNYCKAEADLQCSICKNTYYCSKECQMKDWYDHREECSKKQ